VIELDERVGDDEQALREVRSGTVGSSFATWS